MSIRRLATRHFEPGVDPGPHRRRDDNDALPIYGSGPMNKRQRRIPTRAVVMVSAIMLGAAILLLVEHLATRESSGASEVVVHQTSASAPATTQIEAAIAALTSIEEDKLAPASIAARVTSIREEEDTLAPARLGGDSSLALAAKKRRTRKEESQQVRELEAIILHHVAALEQEIAEKCDVRLRGRSIAPTTLEARVAALEARLARNCTKDAAALPSVSEYIERHNFDPVMPKEYFIETVEMVTDLLFALDHWGIIYFQSGGTFIGIVRHQGMVPWDDDADFYVERNATSLQILRSKVYPYMRSRGWTKAINSSDTKTARTFFGREGIHDSPVQVTLFFWCRAGKQMPVNFLQNTISDRTHCIAQLRLGSSFLLSVLRFLDRMLFLNCQGSQHGDFPEVAAKHGTSKFSMTMHTTEDVLFPQQKLPWHRTWIWAAHDLEGYFRDIITPLAMEGNLVKGHRYSDMMTTAVITRAARHAMKWERRAMKTNISAIAYLKNYDPTDFENTLPFPTYHGHDA